MWSTVVFVALSWAAGCGDNHERPDARTTYTTLVIPKDPDHSILDVRVNTATMRNHIPQLGSELTDPRATALVLGWINSL